MSLFRHAVFETSVAKAVALPPCSGPEIAFAGRSNAGKSSCINTLAGHTRLAFVSKTPGRTQLINFFRLTNGASLVDLPGYGYADVPFEIRRHWQHLLEQYLTRRECLAGLVMIMDARRPLTELDWQMLEWFGPRGLPIHLVLTKADKLSRREQAEALRQVRQAMQPAGEQVSVQLFSSLKKSGIAEAEQAIGSWLVEPEPGALAAAPAQKEGPPVKGEKTGGQLP
jgi:GTP-binding protein